MELFGDLERNITGVLLILGLLSSAAQYIVKTLAEKKYGINISEEIEDDDEE